MNDLLADFPIHDPLEAQPRTLRRLLFQQPRRDQSTIAVLLWWEGRRLLYNLVVGLAGLVTIVILGITKPLVPAAPFFVDWQLVLLFAAMANLLYALGWLTELWLRRYLGVDHPSVGPVLFRYGLVASGALALLPIALALLVSANRILGRPIAGW